MTWQRPSRASARVCIVSCTVCPVHSRILLQSRNLTTCGNTCVGQSCISPWFSKVASRSNDWSSANDRYIKFIRSVVCWFSCNYHYYTKIVQCIVWLHQQRTRCSPEVKHYITIHFNYLVAYYLKTCLAFKHLFYCLLSRWIFIFLTNIELYFSLSASIVQRLLKSGPPSKGELSPFLFSSPYNHYITPLFLTWDISRCIYMGQYHRKMV